MTLWILRACFIAVAAGAGVSLMWSKTFPIFNAWWTVPLTVLCAIALILTDMAFRHKRIDLISSVYFGTIVGLFLTFVASLALRPFFEGYSDANIKEIQSLIFSFLGIGLCYLCISLLWQTRDNFRFIIPYVEFSREVKGNRPYILDTSAIIDGRVADLIETNILDSPLVVPRFVLGELQGIADSSDRIRRERGRRGLDVMDRLRKSNSIDLQIYDDQTSDMENHPVDMKLLLLAKHLDAKVVTGDYNLNKVAKVQNVPVVNLNDIANALKPAFLPGEKVTVNIIKAGEGAGQGVAYLEDGTMIVVDEGRDHIGFDVVITVTSMLQKSSGRMVFGKFESLVRS